MKTIKTNAIITSMASRKDRSVRLSVETPELTDNEFAVFRSYQGINTIMTIEPLDYPADEMMEVVNDLDNKTPSQRMRSVLYVIYKSKPRNEPFPYYYQAVMDKLIDKLKEEIEPGDYASKP